ncbi:MAG: hypothetical protein IT370_06110 [Deltaproteobacteria bacterium]|nr:hypothetical protein [Deltaproteobacteria bacterium]
MDGRRTRMTSLLISFLLVLILPLLMATWRASLLGLALQGVLMGSMVLEHGSAASVSTGFLLADLFFVRGLLVPWIFWRILGRQTTTARNDVIPANLASWLMVGVLVVIGFRFGRAMSVNHPHSTIGVAVAASGVLLGFFVLATQNSPFSQIVGALRLENAIALFELLPPEHHPPLLIQIGLTLLFPLTLFTLAGFMQRLDAAALEKPAPPEESSL